MSQCDFWISRSAIYRCDQCAHLYHAEVPIVTVPDEMTITAMQVVA